MYEYAACFGAHPYACGVSETSAVMCLRRWERHSRYRLHRRRYLDRPHGQLGQFNLSARAGDGRLRWWQRRTTPDLKR